MTFTTSTYVNFVSEDTAARERLFLEYMGWREDFDIIIVGSGIGGGVLADDLADRLGSQKRIPVPEAGSGRAGDERVDIDGSHSPGRGPAVAGIVAQRRFRDRGNPACPAPALSEAGRHAQG